MRWWEFQEAALVTTWRADREISSYCVGFFLIFLLLNLVINLWSPSSLPKKILLGKKNKNDFHSRCAPWLYVAPAAKKLCLPLTDSS